MRASQAITPSITPTMLTGNYCRINPREVDINGTNVTGLRVLVVSHYASDRIGGEASIPLHLFRQLRSRGVEAWLVTHDGNEDELRLSLASDLDRVFFVPSLPGFKWLLPVGERLPEASRALAWSVTQVERQFAMLPVVRNLVRTLDIDVVHQPISVSTAIPSPLRRVGAPVVMGPMNCGMDLPPAFHHRDSLFNRLRKRSTPLASWLTNSVVRGRLEANVLLVANDRTKRSLPRSVRGRIAKRSDIGIVLEDWPPVDRSQQRKATVRFCFIGRLVQLKAVDLLLTAFSRLPANLDVQLDIVGDGPEWRSLTDLASILGLKNRVLFRGWLHPTECRTLLQGSDVLVLPSLQEAGGVVSLEAMAAGIPVIASRWGGPVEMVGEDAGLLVDVSTAEGFVEGLTAAMTCLAQDTGMRIRLGSAGRRRVEERLSWEQLTEQTLSIYSMAATSGAAR